MKLKVDRGSWRRVTVSPKRIEGGITKIRLALEQDAKEAAERGSGLPVDWRNRILKST